MSDNWHECWASALLFPGGQEEGFTAPEERRRTLGEGKVRASTSSSPAPPSVLCLCGEVRLMSEDRHTRSEETNRYFRSVEKDNSLVRSPGFLLVSTQLHHLERGQPR